MSVSAESLLDHARRVRRFIVENPDASVDIIARWASANRCGLGKGVISDLRRQVRAELAAEGADEVEEKLERLAGAATAKSLQATGAVIRTKAPPDIGPVRPRLMPSPPPEKLVVSFPDKPPAPASEQPVAEPRETVKKPEPELGRGNTREDAAERKRYLNELVEENPLQTIGQLKAKLRARYDMGVDPGYICETLRIARQMRIAPQPQPPPPEPQPPPPAPVPPPPPAPSGPLPPPASASAGPLDEASVRSIAQQMKAGRIRRLTVELSADGEVSWSAERWAESQGKMRI